MNNDMARPNLDDVLNEFVASVDRPDWKTLQLWMARFPYYAHELSDFAAAWILSETLPENPETAALPEAHWNAIGRRAFERAVAEQRAEYMPELTLTSLVSAAKEQGLDLAALASTTRLSEQLLIKLERRLLEAASVPKQIVRDLAQTLHTTAEGIANYLTQPATLAAGAQYRAERTPAVQKKESFAAAVQNDRSITDEDRERLLAMAREDNDSA